MKKKKIRKSFVFDVLPEQEMGIDNAIVEFLKNFNVNRVSTHRRVVEFDAGGEKT